MRRNDGNRDAGRNVNPDPPVQAITIPDSTPSLRVNRDTRVVAGSAKSFTFWACRQDDERGAVRLFADGIDNMAFPKRDRRQGIKHGCED